jgi:hypothetical protein
MRQAIWNYVQSYDQQARQLPGVTHGLIDLAREIAAWPAVPASPYSKRCHICPRQTCPQPLNYLVNGVSPAEAPKGLAGRLPADFALKGARSCQPVSVKSPRLFIGCNFNVLAPFAEAKGSSAKAGEGAWCGFGAQDPSGLSILFGPWADFCLHCWQSYPGEFEPDQGPILILAKTCGPLVHYTVQAGLDWGNQELEGFFGSPDSATHNLFSAILAAAQKTPPRPFTGLTVPDQDALRRFIAHKRIFVFYVLPWFCCGQNNFADKTDLNKLVTVPQLDVWVQVLINCLRPMKIATLGAWAFTGDDYGVHELTDDVQHDRPTLFTRHFLKGTPFDLCTGQDTLVRHFHDPGSLWNAWPKRTGSMCLPWFFHIPEYANRSHLPNNAEAFIQFLTS